MEIQWAQLAVNAGSVVVGGLGGLFGGVWWMGGLEGRISHKIIQSTAEVEGRMKGTVETLGTRFHDSLQSIREKVTEVELNTERKFVSKEGFEDFRREYREDRKEDREQMKALMDKIDHINSRQRQ